MSELVRATIESVTREHDDTCIRLRAHQIHPEGNDLMSFDQDDLSSDPARAAFANRFVARLLADATADNAMRKVDLTAEGGTFQFIGDITIVEELDLFLPEADEQTLAKVADAMKLELGMVALMREAARLRSAPESEREVFAKKHGLEWDIAVDDDGIAHWAHAVEDRSYECWRASRVYDVRVRNDAATHLEPGTSYTSAAYGGE